jgi:hypothetical protein
MTADQLLQIHPSTITTYTQYLAPLPRDTSNASRRRVSSRDQTEESLAQIQITLCTSLTRVHHLRLILLSPVRDRDISATQRIVVGIARVVDIHDVARNRDNGIIVARAPAAGAQTCSVVGEVASVWGTRSGEAGDG